MAEIKPFRGMRYTAKAGPIGTLTCPPADGAEKGPCGAELLYLCPAEEAARRLQQWLADALLKIDMDPAFYLYEQQTLENGWARTVRGFLALARLDAFVTPPATDFGMDFGTETSAEAAELARLRAAPCGLFPICAFYRDEKGLMQQRLDALSRDTPRYSLRAGGAVHRLWIINDPVVLRASRADFSERALSVAADAGGRNALLYRAALARRQSGGEQGQPDAEDGCALMLLLDEERAASLSGPQGPEEGSPAVMTPENAAQAIPSVPAGLVMQPYNCTEAPL